MTELTSRTILVLGATGAMGRSIVSHLLASPDNNWRIRAFTRDPESPQAQKLLTTGANGERVELFKGDLNDSSSLEAEMRGVYGVFCNTDFLITRPSDPDAFGSVLREVTARDPVGALGQIVEGQVYCHEVDDYYASWFPEAAVYHRQQGHQVTWNFPFRVGQEVVGYLAMAFREKRSPNQVMTETVQSLAHQVSLALETLRLAEEASQLAIFQERNHIAREVHDTLAQDFAGILMQLQAVLCFMDANPAQAHTHLNRARELARTGITAARRSVWALRQDSSDYSEFLHLLTHLTEQMALGTSVHTQVQIQGTPYPLPSEVGLNLLRIAQEAITNALRHADAERLELQLNYNSNCVQLSIQDNGRGFDLQILMRGLGLMGMQQRADLIGAQLDISSVPGAGTTITMEMPIFRKNEAEPRDN